MARVTRNTLGALLDIFDEHVDAVDSNHVAEDEKVILRTKIHPHNEEKSN